MATIGFATHPISQYFPCFNPLICTVYPHLLRVLWQQWNPWRRGWTYWSTRHNDVHLWTELQNKKTLISYENINKLTHKHRNTNLQTFLACPNALKLTYCNVGIKKVLGIAPPSVWRTRRLGGSERGKEWGSEGGREKGRDNGGVKWGAYCRLCWQKMSTFSWKLR